MNELEDATLELLNSSDDFARFSLAVQSVADRYQPGEEVFVLHFKMIFCFSDDVLCSNPLSPKIYSLSSVG